MQHVMTVTGPVNIEQLGVTLPHEHLLLDLTCLWTPPHAPNRQWLVDAPVTAALHQILNQDPYHSRPNLRLDEPEIVLAEVEAFKAAGGQTLVDLSSSTIGPFPREILRIAQRTGLNIVTGTGFYVYRAHPQWMHDASVEQLRDHMVRDLTVGFADTGIKAGVIGELGTSSPVHPDEEKVLIAAAQAQRAFPVAINVHLSIFAQEGLRVLDLLERHGANLSRVVLSHLDENLDTPYHETLLRRGVFIEFDTFGSECQFRESNTREPLDTERARSLKTLADKGYLNQLLISQDVCTKIHWHHYGGRGYDHILTTVVPQLTALGFLDTEIRQLTVRNPARLLTGSP